MNRREMMVVGGMGAAGFAFGTGFTAPACGVSKEKAVKYTGFAIGYLKDILPIVSQLGSKEIASLINRALPLLDKVKTALNNSEFPTAGSLFQQVIDVLKQIQNALLQLPESPRLDQIMAILTLVNLTLRTVSLFVDAEAPSSVMASMPEDVRKSAAPDPIRRAFQASRF